MAEEENKSPNRSNSLGSSIEESIEGLQTAASHITSLSIQETDRPVPLELMTEDAVKLAENISSKLARFTEKQSYEKSAIVKLLFQRTALNFICHIFAFGDQFVIFTPYPFENALSTTFWGLTLPSELKWLSTAILYGTAISNGSGLVTSAHGVKDKLDEIYRYPSMRLDYSFDFIFPKNLTKKNYIQLASCVCALWQISTIIFGTGTSWDITSSDPKNRTPNPKNLAATLVALPAYYFCFFSLLWMMEQLRTGLRHMQRCIHPTSYRHLPLAEASIASRSELSAWQLAHFRQLIDQKWNPDLSSNELSMTFKPLRDFTKSVPKKTKKTVFLDTLVLTLRIAACYANFGSAMGFILNDMIAPASSSSWRIVPMVGAISQLLQAWQLIFQFELSQLTQDIYLPKIDCGKFELTKWIYGILAVTFMTAAFGSIYGQVGLAATLITARSITPPGGPLRDALDVLFWLPHRVLGPASCLFLNGGLSILAIPKTVSLVLNIVVGIFLLFNRISPDSKAIKDLTKRFCYEDTKPSFKQLSSLMVKIKEHPSGGNDTLQVVAEKLGYTDMSASVKEMIIKSITELSTTAERESQESYSGEISEESPRTQTAETENSGFPCFRRANCC